MTNIVRVYMYVYTYVCEFVYIVHQCVKHKNTYSEILNLCIKAA